MTTPDVHQPALPLFETTAQPAASEHVGFAAVEAVGVVLDTTEIPPISTWTEADGNQKGGYDHQSLRETAQDSEFAAARARGIAAAREAIRQATK